MIGTEVPTPGGATEDLGTLAVTTPQAAAATIDAHRAAFARAGLEAAWPRVIALVVQPGVEFDHHKVIDYRPREARALSDFIGRQSQFVFEAHSTDYQSADGLRCAGARSLRDPEGRARRHVCVAGDAVGTRRHRAGTARSEPVPDLRKVVVGEMLARPAALARPLPRRRREPRLRPAVQPERSDPLLLAVPGSAARRRRHAASASTAVRFR